MAILDPDGMYLGDRMAKLSLKARLYWPYFFLLGNGFARFEVNYSKIVSRAFSTFPEIPSQAVVQSLVEEYAGAYLLFLYRHNGQVWGQWDTIDKYLPRHKTAADLKSPVPPPDSFATWKKLYVESKERPSEAISNLCDLFKNGARDFGNLAEDFGNSVRGVGVVGGVGGGEGKNIASDPLPKNLEVTPGQIFQMKPKPEPQVFSAAGFKVWFARWVVLTKRRQHESDALGAWIDKVVPGQESAVMACLERYGASEEISRAVVTNPDKWLYEQSKDGWTGEWPPARASPKTPVEKLWSDLPSFVGFSKSTE